MVVVSLGKLISDRHCQEEGEVCHAFEQFEGG
jgi:hypothetical protein